MKKVSKSLLRAIVAVFISGTLAHANVPCMFIDLVGHEAQVYEWPFLELLKIAGFAPSYVGLHTFVDDPALIDSVVKTQRGIFLVIGADLMAHITTSPIGKKLIQLLDRVATVPNFFVGLLLPSFNGNKTKSPLLPALHNIFTPLGVSTEPVLLETLEVAVRKPIGTQELMAASIDFFLRNPVLTRPKHFHTTLSAPHEGQPLVSRLMHAAHSSPTQSLTLLPAHSRRFGSKKIQPTLPYFLYTYSPKKKIHLFIGSEILASGFGITEQFHVRPLKVAYARQMLDLIGLSMAQFHDLVTMVDPKQRNFHQIVRRTKKPDFSSVLNQLGKQDSDNDQRVLRKIAWMELNIFEPLSSEQAKKMTVNEQKKRQAQLINYLVTSRFDGLWITFNAHQLWSPIARKKEQEPNFLASIATFTRQLAAACKRAGCAPPALLAGFEITNNIYQPNLPATCAVDTFGNEFKDVPAPLDESFWRNEVICPLQKLACLWKDQKISHGVPLKGIMLDLEMYCRKHIGSFTPGTGFDQPTVAAYDPDLIGEKFVVDDVVKKLMNQRAYGAFLKMRMGKARELGKALRLATKVALGDDAYVMCYAQNLMIDWFYKGLYQGLSTQKDPLSLLTFNTEFMVHKPWLAQQEIFINHGCVVMLSKLQSPRKFGYINYVRQGHQIVWLNRVSRLVEDYDQKSWVGIEQTPMNDRGKIVLARHLAGM